MIRLSCHADSRVSRVRQPGTRKCGIMMPVETRERPRWRLIAWQVADFVLVGLGLAWIVEHLGLV